MQTSNVSNTFMSRFAFQGLLKKLQLFKNPTALCKTVFGPYLKHSAWTKVLGLSAFRGACPKILQLTIS